MQIEVTRSNVLTDVIKDGTNSCELKFKIYFYPLNVDEWRKKE